MKRHLPFYVLAAAILIVGAMAFGFPVSSLWILGFVVLCPLMMIFMMGGMHGGDDHSGHGHSGHGDGGHGDGGHGDGGQSGGYPTEDRDPTSRLGH